MKLGFRMTAETIVTVLAVLSIAAYYSGLMLLTTWVIEKYLVN